MSHSGWDCRRQFLSCIAKSWGLWYFPVRLPYDLVNIVLHFLWEIQHPPMLEKAKKSFPGPIELLLLLCSVRRGSLGTQKCCMFWKQEGDPLDKIFFPVIKGRWESRGSNVDSSNYHFQVISIWSPFPLSYLAIAEWDRLTCCRSCIVD